MRCIGAWDKLDELVITGQGGVDDVQRLVMAYRDGASLVRTPYGSL